jgi:hypothetical protein
MMLDWSNGGCVESNFRATLISSILYCQALILVQSVNVIGYTLTNYGVIFFLLFFIECISVLYREMSTISVMYNLTVSSVSLSGCYPVVAEKLQFSARAHFNIFNRHILA